MKAFSDLFNEEYNTERVHWEMALRKELKTEDVGPKTLKKHLDLGSWPTLSQAATPHSMPASTPWKKAAQTYTRAEASKFESYVKEDLAAGVRVFFMGEQITQGMQEQAQALFKAHPDAKDIEVYSLGPTSEMITAAEVHQKGGTNVLELALLTCKLIESLDKPELNLGVYLDSHFFKNIAKIRALKMLAGKVLQTAEVKKTFKVFALNSYREWTLYERYSNMLRNNVQVASGMIAGADVVQSSGYQCIFDLETNATDLEHEERSLRMCRNTSHILGLESMLGMVEDAAFGSFHLENLSEKYAQEAWTLMQTMIKMGRGERENFLAIETQKTREERLTRVKTRKDVLAGLNDFPNGQEHLKVKTNFKPEFFRVAQVFEELRLKVEKMAEKPKVQILLQGDYAALNNRVNFIKNYFELIGLEVLDPMHSNEVPTKRILVLCAADADYPELAKKAANEKAVTKFVAWKVEVSGFAMIHAGQNVYDVLSSLVRQFEV